MLTNSSTYWGGEHARCRVTTPQGEQILLSVPLCKHTDGRISYMHHWQHQHWMALVSAYGKTPYFDYYRPYIEPLYHRQWVTIDELNRTTAYLLDCFLENEWPECSEALPADIVMRTHPRMLDLIFEYGPEAKRYI